IVTDNPLKQKVKHFEGVGMDATGGNAGGNLGKNGECFAHYDFVCDADYEFRLRACQDRFGDEPARMVFRLDGKDVESFGVDADRGSPKVYTVKLKVAKGKHKFAAAYTNNKVDNDNADPSKRGDRNLYVEAIDIDGPLNAPP